MEMVYGQEESSLKQSSTEEWMEDADDPTDELPPPPPPLDEQGEEDVSKDEIRALNRHEIWNITFCLLAWAFAVSNVTLVVGTSNIIMLSIGGSPRMTSVPLGTFFMGAFLISCGSTGTLFRAQGRKFTFFVGIAVSMFGTMLGGVSLMVKSPIVLSIATLCFGAANGIAFFLRFAAIELVPKEWVAKAVALVVSGGVIAAFAGPESSLATRGLFGPEDNLEFMGVFMMTGIFSVLMALCIAAVTFPSVAAEDYGGNGDSVAGFFTMYYHLLQTKSFIVPLAVVTLAWAIMSMPMSLLRVAMTQAGHSARDSLLAIELHFVGMYGTGFISGNMISRFGHKAVTAVGLLFSCLSIMLALLTKEDSPKTIWIIGLLLLGIGWNLKFTGATIWLTKSNDTIYSKGQIQAANDSLMFLVAGIFTFSASYIFEAGGSDVQGWRVLNSSVIALLTLLGSILLFDQLFSSRQTHHATKGDRPERLDSFDESIIDEINQELERERHTGTAPPNSPSGACTILQDLVCMDNVSWPPPPPSTSLRIVDIEEGASYHPEMSFK